MSGQRKRVFLTGATGNWGRFALAEFAKRADRFDVIALVLPTPADREVIGRYEDMKNLDVRFGDLTDYAAVRACVAGADFVVHLGGVVSPLGDDNPQLALRVNVGSMRNIVAAVQAQPNPEQIGVIGVGTIAETGTATRRTIGVASGIHCGRRVSTDTARARSSRRRNLSTRACRNGSGCARRASFIQGCWRLGIRS